MITEFFEDSVRVKEWEDDPEEKSEAFSSVSQVPQADFFVAAKCGETYDPDTGVVDSGFVDLANIVSDSLVQQEWNLLSMEKAAEKATRWVNEMPSKWRAAFAQTEVVFVRSTVGMLGENETGKVIDADDLIFS